MKRFSFIILSFFAFLSPVNAYYISPNEFTLNYNNVDQMDYYGVNNGDVSSVYQLNGMENRQFNFDIVLDGSNCGSNIDSTACFDTIHSIEEGSNSKSQYGYFSMCVSKPQLHWEVTWNTCNQSCMQKSNDLVVINNSYKNCTLGLYNTETGSNMTNDGYLVRVYYNIAKWQFLEGAYSGRVNGVIRLYNDSESILYYRFVNDSMISDENMVSFDSGYGIFNHDYTQPDVGGETFLNNGTCVMSYNRMNNYNISTWNRETETLTFNNTLSKERNFDKKNLLDNITGTTTISGVTFTQNLDGSVTVNGTNLSSSTIYYNIVSRGSGRLNLNTGRYTLSGCVGGNDNVFIQLDNGTTFSSRCINEPISFNITDSGIYGVFLVVRKNTTVDNLTFYPQLESGSKFTSYSPYYGYTISYDNIGGSFDIFRWYDTNLNSNGVIQYKLTSYTGKTKIGDLVNCPNSRVCRYENELYFTGSFTDLFNKENSRIKKIEFQYLGTTGSIYFKNPYIYNLEDVPGRATWQSYYQPSNVYICSDSDNGTYYNALSKKVYFNPDKPPESFISNVNSDYQNIFGQSINFYGLTDILNFPIQIITKINNGDYRNCTPLQIPFPGFPNKTLTLPCFSTFLWDKFPSLRDVYNIIIIGVLSLKVGLGTINYIKKWYLGTIEAEEI